MYGSGSEGREKDKLIFPCCSWHVSVVTALWLTIVECQQTADCPTEVFLRVRPGIFLADRIVFSVVVFGCLPRGGVSIAVVEFVFVCFVLLWWRDDRCVWHTDVGAWEAADFFLCVFFVCFDIDSWDGWPCRVYVCVCVFKKKTNFYGCVACLFVWLVFYFKRCQHVPWLWKCFARSINWHYITSSVHFANSVDFVVS